MPVLNRRDCDDSPQQNNRSECDENQILPTQSAKLIVKQETVLKPVNELDHSANRVELTQYGRQGEETKGKRADQSGTGKSQAVIEVDELGQSSDRKSAHD